MMTEKTTTKMTEIMQLSKYAEQLFSHTLI